MPKISKNKHILYKIGIKIYIWTIKKSQDQQLDDRAI